MEDNNILAVVLAGGKSKRFGEDKNKTKLGDKTLLEHVLLKISNKYEEILIVSSQSLGTQKTKNVTKLHKLEMLISLVDKNFQSMKS